MTQITLNLNLAPHLLFRTAILQFALIQDLEYADELVLAFAREVNTAELALTQ